MTEELMRLEKHREALEAFLASPAHAGYVAARQTEIASLEMQILEDDPVDRKTEIESFKQRGELRCLRQLVTIFEDGLIDLKDRIEEELERENKMRSDKVT
jgi:hypothetical protein